MPASMVLFPPPPAARSGSLCMRLFADQTASVRNVEINCGETHMSKLGMLKLGEAWSVRRVPINLVKSPAVMLDVENPGENANPLFNPARRCYATKSGGERSQIGMVGDHRTLNMITMLFYKYSQVSDDYPSRHVSGGFAGIPTTEDKALKKD